MSECPVCGKMVWNLASHISKAHSLEDRNLPGMQIRLDRSGPVSPWKAALLNLWPLPPGLGYLSLKRSPEFVDVLHKALSTAAIGFFIGIGTVVLASFIALGVAMAVGSCFVPFGLNDDPCADDPIYIAAIFGAAGTAALVPFLLLILSSARYAWQLAKGHNAALASTQADQEQAYERTS